MGGRFPISDEGKLRGKGEFQTLTPHISPVWSPGAPKFFLAVGPDVAYLSSKHGVPPVRGRGRGIFQVKFTKITGQNRGALYRKNCDPHQFSSCTAIYWSGAYTSLVGLDFDAPPRDGEQPPQS